jgi:hypothetical protein
VALERARDELAQVSPARLRAQQRRIGRHQTEGGRVGAGAAPAAGRDHRRAIGTPAELASSLHHLASVIRWKQGDAQTAHGLYAEALTHARRAEHRVLTAAALMPLGTLALERDALGEARARLTEGLTLFVAARVPATCPVALEQFAALAEGRPLRAVRRAGAGAAQRERLGTTQWLEMAA